MGAEQVNCYETAGRRTDKMNGIGNRIGIRGRPTGAYRETQRGEGETQTEGGAKIDENKVFF